MKKETVIKHSSQLNALITLPFLRMPGLGVLRLGGEMVRHEKHETWQRELNRNYHACGCDTGAKGLLIGLFAGLIVAAMSDSVRQTAGIVFVAAIAGAIIGKLVGLARAQVRLMQTIREIAKEVRPRESSVVEGVTCG